MEKREDARINCSGVFFVDLTSKVLRFTRDEKRSDGGNSTIHSGQEYEPLYIRDFVSKEIGSKSDQVEMRSVGEG